MTDTPVTLESLWSAYCQVRERAEKSQRIQDGIEAGRAWRRWLDAFDPGGQKVPSQAEQDTGKRLKVIPGGKP